MPKGSQHRGSTTSSWSNWDWTSWTAEGERGKGKGGNTYSPIGKGNSIQTPRSGTPSSIFALTTDSTRTDARILALESRLNNLDYIINRLIRTEDDLVGIHSDLHELTAKVRRVGFAVQTNSNWLSKKDIEPDSPASSVYSPCSSCVPFPTPGTSSS